LKQNTERKPPASFCTVSQKTFPTFSIVTWRKITRLYYFWHEYSWHNWPSNDCSSSHLTWRLFLHYLGKTEQTKYYLFIYVWYCFYPRTVLNLDDLFIYTFMLLFSNLLKTVTTYIMSLSVGLLV